MFRISLKYGFLFRKILSKDIWVFVCHVVSAVPLELMGPSIGAFGGPSENRRIIMIGMVIEIAMQPVIQKSDIDARRVLSGAVETAAVKRADQLRMELLNQGRQCRDEFVFTVRSRAIRSGDRLRVSSP